MARLINALHSTTTVVTNEPMHADASPAISMDEVSLFVGVSKQQHDQNTCFMLVGPRESAPVPERSTYTITSCVSLSSFSFSCMLTIRFEEKQTVCRPDD